MNRKTYYLKKNPCYVKGTSIGKVKGIIVHSTGAVNKTLKRYIQPDDGQLGKNTNSNDWNRSSIYKCVHAMIGEISNGDVWVYEILPYSMACWGCGKGSKGSYNYSPNGHVQFEILEGTKTDKTYFKKAWDTAVEYCVYLCKKFGLTEKDIVSHKEACEEGYASNHADADSYFKIFGKTMTDFRREVRNKLNGSTTSATSTVPTIKFMKINTSGANLNCRKTPSSSGAVLGQFKKDQEVLYVSTTVNGKWIKVKGKSTKGEVITGYCSKDYLKTSISSSTLATINVSGARLNCRKSASTSSAILGQFTKNQKVILVAKTNNSWWKVKGINTDGDVITGYCSASYLK